MSFYYEIPLMSFNRQCFLAVPWQRDCNTKWEFHTAKNATFEASHLICQLTLLKSFRLAFAKHWNALLSSITYAEIALRWVLFIFLFDILFVFVFFIYAGRLTLSFG